MEGTFFGVLQKYFLSANCKKTYFEMPKVWFVIIYKKQSKSVFHFNFVRSSTFQHWCKTYQHLLSQIHENSGYWPNTFHYMFLTVLRTHIVNKFFLWYLCSFWNFEFQKVPQTIFSLGQFLENHQWPYSEFSIFATVSRCEGFIWYVLSGRRIVHSQHMAGDTWS